MWLLELLSTAAVAQAPQPIVTFDNGGFNAAFYAPRYVDFAQPSVAQEIAASIARVAGQNPMVFSYLPPGRAAGRPGDAYQVMPHRAGCVGEAAEPGDPCWCGPGDRCWTDLDVNRHPGGSTSLYLTAGRIRGAASGARIEIHFTDLFEEDPSTAENPADSDKCVTRSGAHKALEGLLASGDSSIDHLAVGLLRVRIDSPPSGRDVGSTFAFEEGEGGCWSGRSSGKWDAGRAPIDWGMGVVVLGLDTADQHVAVTEFLDGLEVQLGSEKMALSLVRLREPPEQADAAATVAVDELASWRPEASERATTLPCERVEATARFTLDGQPILGASADGDCGGGVALHLPTHELRAAWARANGLNPFARDGVVEGSVQLRAAPGAMVQALEQLGTANAAIADRPLPLWDVVQELARTGGSGMRTFSRDVNFRVAVAGLDTRPWIWSLITGLVFGLAGAAAASRMLIRVQANRAYQAAWDRMVRSDSDPLRQRPLAAVLAEAQDEVRRRWFGRWVGAALLALLLGTGMSYLLLRLAVLRVALG